MQVTIDKTPFVREAERVGRRTAFARARIWTRIRVVSFDAERWIKIKMPVDTGRARGSWGHSSPPALPTDSIWQEDEKNLAITQGSRVGYIEYLNEGSSTQAPRGFIDAEEKRAADQLDRQLAEAVEWLFGEDGVV